MAPFTFRKWQDECFERFLEVVKQGESSFVFEACMGAGKSTMAARIAKALVEGVEGICVNHVLVVVPWTSIQGDVDKGMLGTFSEMGLDPRKDFFTYSRRQVRQPIPQMYSTVTLYWEVCCQQAIDTIRMWMREGWKFGLICDEIHHTNEINSSWGMWVKQLEELATFSVFMSGTYFRSDRKPISCIDLDETGAPRKHYRYPYRIGVRDNVVRAVTTREINATVQIYDAARDRHYEVELSQITNQEELAKAKVQVLDPTAPCIAQVIERVHQDLMQTRFKFPDAACLFVCRPGGSDNFTMEAAEEQEDKHVNVIAREIQRLTGEMPTVVTHKDRDSAGKITRFRRGVDPYIVAVNMISEGCDIPRLRAVAFCRYTDSEMLFRQIVGRALRMTALEDGTAAQIYIPAFPVLLQFAERLYSEAQEGVHDRTCPVCGGWPCVCPCPRCGQRPCVCVKDRTPRDLPSLIGIDATPVLDGGHVGEDHVAELYVRYAGEIAKTSEAHRHTNHVQMGHALYQFVKLQAEGNREKPSAPAGAAQPNAAAEREWLRKKINKYARKLAFDVYGQDYKRAWHEEVEVPFHAPFKTILNTWRVERLKEVADRLERRVRETLRRG